MWHVVEQVRVAVVWRKCGEAYTLALEFGVVCIIPEREEVLPWSIR